MASYFGALGWFIAVLALIPLALWLLRRTPMGTRLAIGPMRSVASLSITPTQKVVTVEVGGGDERRWLVLGVTNGGINLLYTLTPQDPVPKLPSTPSDGFAQLLSRLKGDGGDRGAN